MAEIKNVIFDLGDVLAHNPAEQAARNFAQFSDIEVRLIQEALYNDTGSVGLLQDYETGKIGTEEFIEQIRTALRLDSGFSIDTLMNAMGVLTEVPGMFGLVSRIQERYGTAMLSNTSYVVFVHTLDNLEVVDLVGPPYILSYQVGAKKPDERIWNEALRQLDTKPEECVYVDDIEFFVRRATSLGFRGIHFRGVYKLEEELREVGLNI